MGTKKAVMIAISSLALVVAAFPLQAEEAKEAAACSKPKAACASEAKSCCSKDKADCKEACKSKCGSEVKGACEVKEACSKPTTEAANAPRRKKCGRRKAAN